MMTFCGYDLELVIDVVLARSDWSELCCADDLTGKVDQPCFGWAGPDWISVMETSDGPGIRG
jgi:hypothetical protein